MKKYLSITLLLVGLTAGFVGGCYFKNYQQLKQRNSLRNGAVGQRFTPNSNGQNRGTFGGGIEGNVISMDEKSVTIKLADGSSKIIFLSDATNYSTLSTALKTDIKNGIKILVSGKSNTDGSLTADRIQFSNVKP